MHQKKINVKKKKLLDGMFGHLTFFFNVKNLFIKTHLTKIIIANGCMNKYAPESPQIQINTIKETHIFWSFSQLFKPE